MNLNYYRDTVAEIDLDAIAFNLRSFRTWLPQTTQMMAVVKANAYGHGAVPVARTALTNGASFLGVATLDEAIELREAGIRAPVLVMGFIPERGLEEAIRRDVRITVYRVEHLNQIIRAAGRLNRQAKVHIKVDTGMGRLGVRDYEVFPLVKQAAASDAIVLEGMFTHFACADEMDKAYTHRQAELFEQIVAACRKEGVAFPLLHCGNSAAAIDLPQYGYNMVRIGISLYGLYPSLDVKRSNVSLRPAMSFKTRIVHVKQVPPGTGISYGITYRAQEEETIATLPVGYADGFNRLLSNRGSVLVRGRRVPVVGRVCMDQTLIKLPRAMTVDVGEEVVLFGRQGDEHIHVDDIARMLGTINYEVTCMVSRRVPRIYKKDGRIVEVRVDTGKIIS